ncbi:MAG: N-acetyltransferase [Muribaculaceae bacterium]|nr:N-acetyltransferase [Muribaculaceae bacterium]
MKFVTDKDRIYATDASGKVVAEVTFPTVNGVSTINHTFVDPSLRGEGVAGKLVKLAADHIIAEGNKLAATCSYAVAWFKRHPEYKTVCSGPVACRIDIPKS